MSSRISRRQFVKAGLGVAILARWAVQPLIDAGSLVGRALPARGMHRVWSAVTRKDLARTDYVAGFIDLIEKHAPTTRSGLPAAIVPVARLDARQAAGARRR